MVMNLNLVDYHSDWFSSLWLAPSDGKRQQLDAVKVQDDLERMENFPKVHGAVQVFNRVQIEHAKFMIAWST